MNANGLAILSALALVSCAPAKATVAKPAVPADPAPLAAMLNTRSTAREIACELADRVGPRLAGSPGDARAVAWAEKKMSALGLANVHTEPVTVPHWERGAISASVTGEGIDLALSATALGGSVPARAIDAEIVEVETLDALAALPDGAVKGKVVFFTRAMTRGQKGFESYGATVPIRSTGASEAAKRGAIAVMIRSVGTSNARFPHTGGVRYAENVAKIPAIAIAIPDAETVSRLLKTAPLHLKLTMETRDLGTSTSSNVIGEVRGREKPDEIMLIGAHLDSWDLGDGAIDDGAGVGVVLDVAHALLAAPPRRTVRVILFANEENGLKGAFAYAAAHAAELDKHQLVLEIDAGYERVFGLEWSAMASASPVFETLGRRLAPLGVATPTEQDGAGGADTIPIRGASVPSLELLQDGSRYFDLHHTADDTCDKIEPAEIAQVRDVALITTYSLADAPSLFERFAPKPPDAKH